jgi:regulator of sigma E protease
VEPTYAPVDSVDTKINTVAATVGLQAGDVITELNGQPISYYDEIAPIIKDKKIDTLSIKVKRGDEVNSFVADYRGHTRLGFRAKGIEAK